MITCIYIKMNSVGYDVQQTNEDGLITVYANDWEITSSHKMDLAVSSLVKMD